jgi:hypothetical protein
MQLKLRTNHGLQLEKESVRAIRDKKKSPDKYRENN